MIKPYTELLLATFLWGFGFVAAVWTLTAVGPLWLTALRFFLAILMLAFFHRSRYSWRQMKSVFLPGISLFALLAFQTWGLKYTSPTKSGFITVLYVMFVPLFERIFLKYPMRKIIFLWIALALLGTALICQLTNFNEFNFGDFLTFICAMAAAAQFIFINLKINEVSSPVAFHIYQCAWVMFFSIVFAIPLEGFGFLHQNWSPLAWMGLIQLGFFSAGIAFLIQIRAQQKLASSTVAIFMLLESPWAMISSVIFLKEKLSILQMAGAALILLAAAGEIYSSPHSAKARTSAG